ncbi:hypothetical protein CBA19CS91_15640 [Paraburkholderia hospita]|nr:hypothetical protein CBA19CS91_15640 [Paraburkholderia hospita]
MNHSPDDALEPIRKALRELTQRGNLTYGTSALVESLKDHWGVSYADVADRAGVTEQGLRRWRQNNSGETARFEKLITIANRELAKDASVVEKPSAAENPTRSVADAFKYVPLQQVERTLQKAFSTDLGILPGSCKVTNVEMEGPAIRLTLMLE